ncbi:MAG TPA: phosphatase PAP2 family protein [Humisphaera sp.]|jgi:membrane-associated phospholipid phosphatase|nr:phosphatase PAP2 family protein [Humisphaera sp.]
MNLPLLIGLVVSCGVLMLLESRGLPTTLALKFKGDIKRESRLLAQYGQFVCTVIAALLVWQLDPPHRRGAIVLLIAVIATSFVSTLIKRLLSRVRPGRENAGKFLGPHWRHDNHRESFPSSHSACAVSLSVMLTILYPQGAATFWALALICAALRYVMDAHWPSDVLGGIALGYVVAYASVWLIHL